MLSKKRLDRKLMHHTPPFWVSDDAIFFLTINCQHRGSNQLANEDIADQLIQPWIFYRDQGKCAPLLILVMPDHMHLLISFSWKEGEGMPALVQSWKRYTARQNGIQWQREFFDHRIRNKDDFEQKWNYIIDNPVNAGLVTSPEHWPYRWITPHSGESEYL